MEEIHTSSIEEGICREKKEGAFQNTGGFFSEDRTTVEKSGQSRTWSKIDKGGGSNKGKNKGKVEVKVK